MIAFSIDRFRRKMVYLITMLLASSVITLSVDVIVTFHFRLWQREIFTFLTTNASCLLDDKDFVWRSNPGAVSIPTDFGIVRVPADEATMERFKQCMYSKIDIVKGIYFDGPPVSRVLQFSSSSVIPGDETEIDYQGESSTPDTNADDTHNAYNSFSSGSDPRRRGFTVVRSFPNMEHIKEGGRTILNSAANQNPFIPASIASDMHNRGYFGQGVNVAIFDSGLSDNHPHFKNVRERTNWTADKKSDDEIGHGSFVAGVVAGRSPDCPGIAPHSNLYIFRVFSSEHQSYTSWFLDAFNYALFLDIDVINFSIGGPDYADKPFTDKINELSANGIIVISAVGNDGPLWGSILNPADQSDVLSVGGWGGHERIAEFSSRGMTTSEISLSGMGRIKPDVLAPSVLVHSSGPSSPYKCRSLSGTSVATPVVTGVIVAMLSQAFEPYDSHQNLKTTQSDQQSLGTNINSTHESYKSNLRGRSKESENGNFTAWMDDEIIYDRKSPKFLRMKNVAAMKQIINYSARPLKPLGQNLRILSESDRILHLK